MYLNALIIIFILLIYWENNFYLRLALLNIVQAIIYLKVLLLGYTYGVDLILIYLSMNIMIFTVLHFYQK